MKSFIPGMNITKRRIRSYHIAKLHQLHGRLSGLPDSRGSWATGVLTWAPDYECPAAQHDVMTSHYVTCATVAPGTARSCVEGSVRPQTPPPRPCKATDATSKALWGLGRDFQCFARTQKSHWRPPWCKCRAPTTIFLWVPEPPGHHVVDSGAGQYVLCFGHASMIFSHLTRGWTEVKTDIPQSFFFKITPFFCKAARLVALVGLSICPTSGDHQLFTLNKKPNAEIPFKKPIV